MASPMPNEPPRDQPSPKDDWFDASKAKVLKKGQPESTVTVHYPAMVDFPEDAMGIVAAVCKECGFAGSRPWGFLVKPGSGPVNHLILKPVEEKDPRAVPFRLDGDGPGCRLNLRAAYAHYSIETYPNTLCRVPVMMDDDPVYGPILRYFYGQQTREGVTRRGRRSRPQGDAGGAPT